MWRGRARDREVEMLEGLGLPMQGRHHSGLDDCRNIARVLIALAQRGDNPPAFATGMRVLARWFPKVNSTIYQGRWFAAEATVTDVYSNGVRVKFANGGDFFDYTHEGACLNVCAMEEREEVCVPR